MDEYQDNESRKWLYKTLSDKQYNLNIGTEEEFNNLMNTNPESRKWVYETATNLGFNVGKDQNEFDSLVIDKFDTPQQSAQQEPQEQQAPKRVDVSDVKGDEQSQGVGNYVMMPKQPQQEQKESSVPTYKPYFDVSNLGIPKHIEQTEAETNPQYDFSSANVQAAKDNMPLVNKEANDAMMAIMPELEEAVRESAIANTRRQEKSQGYKVNLSDEQIADNAVRNFKSHLENGYIDLADENSIGKYINSANEGTKSKVKELLAKNSELKSYIDAYYETPEGKAELKAERGRITAAADEQIDKINERQKVGFFAKFSTAGLMTDPILSKNKEAVQILQDASEGYEEQQAAKRELKNVKKAVRAEDWRADGTMKGMAMARGLVNADYESLAPFAGLNDATAKLGLALDIRDGKQLTEDQQDLLDAMALSASVNSAYGDNANVWERVGNALPEQAMFTLQFIIGGEVTGASKAAEVVSKKAAKKAIKKMAKKEIEGKALGDFTKFTLGRAIPEFKGITTGAAMQTFLNPLSYVGIAEDIEGKMAGNVYYDNNGDLHVFDDNKSAAMAVYQAVASAYVENFTEFMGTDIEKAAKLWKTSPKMMKMAQGWDDIMKKTGMKKVSDLFEIPKEWTRVTGISGSFGEFGEEVFGNIFNSILATDRNKGEGYFESVGRTMEQAFSSDQMLETFLSCAVMSVAMGSASSAAQGIQNASYKRDVNKNVEIAGARLGSVKGLDREEFDDVISKNEIQDISKWIRAKGEANNWTKDEEMAAVSYLLSKVQQAGVQHNEEMQIQAVEEQARRDAQDMVNTWDGSHIINAQYKGKDGNLQDVTIVGGRVSATQNEDGTYEYSPYLSSGTVVVRLSDGTKQMVSSKDIVGVQSVNSIEEQLQTSGQLVREQLQQQFAADNMLPTMESVWGGEPVPNETTLFNGRYLYLGKTDDGMYRWGDNKTGKEVAISEGRMIEIGLTENINALEQQRAQAQAEERAAIEQQLSEQRELQSNLSEINDAVEEAKKNPTEEGWKAVENLLSGRIVMDENGGIDPGKSDPKYAAAYMFVKARGDYNTAISEAQQIINNKMAQLEQLTNQEAEGADFGDVTNNAENTSVLRAYLTEQITFMQEAVNQLGAIIDEQNKQAEAAKAEEQRKAEEYRASHPERGDMVNIIYNGTEAVAEVTDVDSEGRYVVTVYDSEQNPIESGLEITQDEYDKMREQINTPAEETNEEEQQVTETQGRSIDFDDNIQIGELGEKQMDAIWDTIGDIEYKCHVTIKEKNVKRDGNYFRIKIETKTINELNSLTDYCNKFGFDFGYTRTSGLFKSNSRTVTVAVPIPYEDKYEKGKTTYYTPKHIPISVGDKITDDNETYVIDSFFEHDGKTYVYAIYENGNHLSFKLKNIDNDIYYGRIKNIERAGTSNGNGIEQQPASDVNQEESVAEQPQGTTEEAVQPTETTTPSTEQPTETTQQEQPVTSGNTQLDADVEKINSTTNGQKLLANKIKKAEADVKAANEVLNKAGQELVKADDAYKKGSDSADDETFEKETQALETALNEALAVRNDAQQKLNTAQAELDRWNAVKDEIERRNNPQQTEAETEQQTEEATQENEPAEPKTEEAEPEQPTTEQPTQTNVPDWTEDKASEARARGFRMVDGRKVDRQKETDGVYGKEAKALFGDDAADKKDGKFKLIPLSSLIGSHTPNGANPLHFIPEAQPKKNRSGEDSVSAARKHAQAIEPNRIAGDGNVYDEASPIINKHGEVIQGNGRTMTLNEMYANFPQQAEIYKQYLKDHAEEFGLKPEDVDAIENPVLAVEIDVDDNEAIRLGQKTQADMESGGTRRIEAARTIAALGDSYAQFVDLLLTTKEEDASLSDAILENGVSALKWLYNKGIINQTQYSSALEDGKLKAEAKEDLRNIVRSSLFNGANESLETSFNALPTAAQNAILQTIHRDLKNIDENKIIEDIRSAIELYYHLSNDKVFENVKKDKDYESNVRKAVAAWMNETSVDFSSGETLRNGEKYTNFAAELAVLFNTKSLKALRDFFNGYYDKLQGSTSGMADMFEAAETLGKAEAIKQVFGIDYLKPQTNENGLQVSDAVADDNGNGSEGRPGSESEPGVGEPSKEGERGTDSGTRTESTDRTREGNEEGEESVEERADVESDEVETRPNDTATEAVVEVGLTDEDIDNAEVDNQTKLLAKDFLKGNKNSITEDAYEEVREYYAEHRPTDTERNSQPTNGTQLAETDNGNQEPEQSGRRGVQTGDVDRGASTEDVSWESRGGENSEDNVPTTAGETSNSNGNGERPNADGQPANGGNSNGSRTNRGNGHNVRGTGGNQQSGGNAANDGGGRTEAQPRSVDEINSDISDVLSELGDLFKSRKPSIPIDEKQAVEAAQESVFGQTFKAVNPNTIVNANDTKSGKEWFRKVRKAIFKLAGLAIEKGYTKFDDWKTKMKEYLKGVAGFSERISDEKLYEILEEAWNCPYEINGEVKTVGEWADGKHAEEVRKMLSKSLDEKRKEQAAANALKIKQVYGDTQNIRETCPYLLPHQIENVAIAERQFFSEEHSDRDHGYGKGYCFTDGTGTGKTYTGLGIARRFVNEGKGRVLILTTKSKVKDWAMDGANMGLEVEALDEGARKNGKLPTQYKGSGIVCTTYANASQNKALLEDTFDLVIYDESHYIMNNKEGDETISTKTHYMLTNKNVENALNRLKANHPLWIKEEELKEELSDLSSILSDANATYQAQKDAQERADQIEEQISQLHSQQNAVIDKMRETATEAVKKTKTVFLSATPFKNIDNLGYAEGYLFSYPEENANTKGSYDHRTPMDEFKLMFFGSMYRWRHHHIEQHIENADAAVQQQQAFADRLMNTLETMSGCVLDNGYDYSRHFPSVEVAMADQFNEAVESLSRDPVIRVIGQYFPFDDYQKMSLLFETMKVAAVTPRIKEHIAKGRKVVVFNRRTNYTQPTAQNPNPWKPQNPFKEGIIAATKAFMVSTDKKEKDAINKAISEFEVRFSSLMEWADKLDYRLPSEQLADVFGDKLAVIDGSVSGKKRLDIINEFNKDDGKYDIILGQERTMREGISIHDTSGNRQRVNISLALPQETTTFIQCEGRIYRIGNRSNAIFEYPLLGINRELSLFALKFNSAVGITENLAMGSNARNLTRSIAKGVLEDGGVVPLDGQGVGGREKDYGKSTRDAYTSAINDYYATQKQKGGRENRDGVDYYATPEPIGYKIVQWLGLSEGESALEPSAGHGAIARYFPNFVRSLAIEPSSKLFSLLALNTGGVDKDDAAAAAGKNRFVQNATFEELNEINKYDGIAMNPPFGKAGATAMEHLDKAWKHLRNSGRLAIIVPTGATNAKMDKWLNEHKNAVVVGEIALPSVTFNRAGTSVNTRILIIDKIDRASFRSKVASKKVSIDLSGLKTIEELFDAMRDVNMPTRMIDPATKLMRFGDALKTKLSDNEIIAYKESSTGKRSNKNGKDFTVSEEGIKFAVVNKYAKVFLRTGGYAYGNYVLGWNDARKLKRRTWAEPYMYVKLSNISKCETLSDFIEETGSYSATQEDFDRTKDFAIAMTEFIRDVSGFTDQQIRDHYNGNVNLFDYSKIQNNSVLTFSDLVNRYEDMEQDPILQTLFSQVSTIAERIGMKIETFDDKYSTTLGSYNPLTNTLRINSGAWNISNDDAEKSQTILHELIHSVTSYALSVYNKGDEMPDGLKEACRRVVMIFESTKNDKASYYNSGTVTYAPSDAPDGARYGFTNPFEMLAEMANPKFRKYLQKRLLWTDAKNAIKQILDMLGLQNLGVKFTMTFRNKSDVYWFGNTDENIKIAQNAGYTPTNAFDELQEALDMFLDNFDKNLFDKRNDYIVHNNESADLLVDEGPIAEVSKSESERLAYQAVRECLNTAGIPVVEATDEMIEQVLSDLGVSQNKKKGSNVELISDKAGKVYGFTKNGVIYLSKKGMNAETQVHEYTHLWAKALQDNNQGLWNEIKDALRDTPTWRYIVNSENYKYLQSRNNPDDAIAEEVLARLSGKINARRLNEEAEKAINNADTLNEAAKIANMISKLRKAVRKFWTWVGENVFGIRKVQRLEANKIADMVLADLVNGVNPTDPNGGGKKRSASSYITPEMDSDFRKAYEEGDTAKAIELVKQAAKMAMPDTKVVDENGDPLVVYHGSPKEFTVFDKKKSSNQFYFSDREDIAKTYSGLNQDKPMKCFLNVRNPKVFDMYGYTYTGRRANWNTAEEAEESINKGRKYGFAYIEGVLAKRNGFDGLILNNVTDWSPTAPNDNGVQNQYIAFSSNQIKSAEPFTFDDNGELIPLSERFNDENDDIRFHMDSATPENLIADDYNMETGFKGANGMKQLWENFVKSWVNSLRPLKQLQDIVERTLGRKLRDSEDAYFKASMMQSVNKVQLEQDKIGYLDPMYRNTANLISEMMAKRGLTYDEAHDRLVNYLLAKHGLERNEYEYQKAKADNPNAEEKDIAGLTGLSEKLELDPQNYKQNAEDIVAEFEGQFKKSVINDYWDTMKTLTDRMLEISYESGMTSRDKYEELKTRFKYYVPLRGFGEKTSEDMFSYIGQHPHFQNLLKKAEGRTSVADDPIPQLANMLQSAIVIGNQNKVMQSLYNLAVNSNSDLLRIQWVWLEKQTDGTWKEVYPDIDADMSADEIDQKIKDFENRMEQEKQNGNARKGKNMLDLGVKVIPYDAKEHEMVAYINGKKCIIYVAGNPKIAQTFNRNQAPQKLLFNGFQPITRFYSALNTTLSPIFMFTNAARDIGFTLFSSFVTSKRGEHKNLHALANMFRAGWVLPRLIITGKMSGGMVKMFSSEEAQKIEQWWNEFINNGGETGFTRTLDVDKMKKDTDRILRRMVNNPNNTDGSWGVKKYTIGVLEAMNRYGEDLSRFAAYCAMRSRQNSTIKDSIEEAKNITLNFSIKGDGRVASEVRALYSFFNASVQGMSKMVELANKNPKRFAVAVGACILQGLMLPALNMLFFAMFGGDDDDWNKYQYLTEYTANHNLILYVGNHKFLKIPYSQELAPFASIGNIYFRNKMGWSNGESAAMQIADMFTGLSPIEIGKSKTIGGKVAKTITPSVFTPLTEVFLNEDYTASPIYKQTAYNKNEPGWTKAYEGRTSKDLIELTKHLNSNDPVVKHFNINPAVVEHLMSSMLGGLGRSGENLIKFLEDPKATNHVPYLRAFMFDSDKNQYAGAVNREYGRYAYDFLNEFNRQKRGYGDLMEYAKILAERNKSIDLDVANVVSAYKTGKTITGQSVNFEGLDKMRKRYNELRATDTSNLSDADKKMYEEAIEGMKEQITELEMQMLDQIDQVIYEAEIKGKKPITEFIRNEVGKTKEKSMEKYETKNK